MAEPVDQEIEAIKTILAALAPLSDKARLSVLDYITKRLDLPVVTPPKPENQQQLTPQGQVSIQPPVGTATHIKLFKEQKRPKSANEMAAVVAYYLANLASTSQRKDTVNQKDIETQFKIAEFPLPKKVRSTLPNAKNAGYFDHAGDGKYKLNAVGYNLVAHSMPREQKADARKRKKVNARKSKQRQR